jgi:hypothetical protein
MSLTLRRFPIPAADRESTSALRHRFSLFSRICECERSRPFPDQGDSHVTRARRIRTTGAILDMLQQHDRLAAILEKFGV